MCVDEEKRMMVLDVFDVLKIKGYGSVCVYNIFMEVFYKMGDIEKFLLFLIEMRDFGFELDLLLYSIVISCFVVKGEVLKVCLYYEKIIEMLCVFFVVVYLFFVRGFS